MATQTDKAKLKAPLWAKGPLRVVYGLLGPAADYIFDAVLLSLLAGVVGGLLTTFGVYVFHLDELLGRLFAQWCLDRGSCNLDTNMLGVGLGVYILACIAVILTYSIRTNLKPDDRSIYDSIRATLANVPDGMTAAQISKRIGYDMKDVHAMLGMMFDEGEVNVREYKDGYTGTIYILR